MKYGKREPEYDERTCITARELRAGGVGLPEEIPSCAWVPRAAVKFTMDPVAAPR